ncbi:MAG: sensor domain-containing diguanylate cyclase [Lachnospiraceae bacterium]|nr:sensor domain-containing diguanylate cyclase [Lachnospiraceae bacterium]
MKNKKGDLDYIKKGHSYYITLFSCLAIFIGAIIMLITGFNRLITQHDVHLSGEICNLVSEKMSNSLMFMADSARNMADALTEQNCRSLDVVYDTVSDYTSGRIVSIGLVDEDGNLYMSDSEKNEFEKMNLQKTALLADPVSISAPYRSTRLGQPVITLFSKFKYNDSHTGYLCVTYFFSTLQEAANTESLTNEIEIWLMNVESANIIQCAGSDPHASGGWANAYLKMSDINREYKPAFDAWYERMLNGEPAASVSYMIGDVRYSQVYSVIKSMPGWCVVVRIPSTALSETMDTFKNYIISFLFIFLNLVVIVISVVFNYWKRETRILGQLSVNDPLTGVLNRRAFELSSEKLFAHSKDASIMFFDIDYFKQVNDTFGHDTGDKLLKAFAGILKSYFSKYGIVSRYGGDEFVVLVHDIPSGQVSDMLDKIRHEVHSIRISDDKKGEDFKISFSAGIAKYPTDAADLTGLQVCADSALYIVKQMGRDGYRWYKQGSEASEAPDQ